MSKNSGIIFSKSLFGYRCKDVTEYIRTVDAEHASELARLNVEMLAFQDKLNDATAHIREMEETIDKERAASQDRIKRITFEYEKSLAELSNSINLHKEKLSESENRASSYLKLVDSSSLRAESAEAELTVLSAAIEDYKAEIASLKTKLEEKEAEFNRLSEFETLTKKLLENNNKKGQIDFDRIVSFFKKSRKLK